MIEETGGPAFPCDLSSYDDDEGGIQYQGMTLRDYFAAKAMQGFLASGVNAPANVFAAKAYEMADAMLKARQA
jgi:hypothetical protein